MSNKHQNRRVKWSLDNIRVNRTTTEALQSPPGYSAASIGLNGEVSRKTDVTRLITKKSWDIALAPMKQVPMNLFIMYMAGNSISIFPIMMVGMMLIRPLQAIWSTKSTFKMIEASSVILQMIVFVLGNIVNIGLALYKCHSMGLLPTHASDWLAFVDPPIRLEYLGGGIKLS